MDKRSPLAMTGIFPPIPTTFDARGGFDVGATAANLAQWNRHPLSGYVILGSNGEMPYLAHAEKVAWFEAVRKLVPADKLFLAGCGCESASETIALVKEAAAIGADAALLITPCYYRSRMDEAALADYYTRVADASPVPVSLYNMPANTGVDMSAALVARLSAHPNIVAVKDSSGNLAKMGEIIRTARPGFQVIAGSAGFLYPALCLGAVGGVAALANIAPRQCCDIFSLFGSGRLAEARELQLRMIAPNTAVTAQYGVPGLKAAMDMVGLRGGAPRSPMQPLGDAEKAQLRAVLAEAGIL
jgi:4-hydroxy-2-oxoglutarate aldolase